MRIQRSLFFAVLALSLIFVNQPRNAIAQISGYELLKMDISARERRNRERDQRINGTNGSNGSKKNGGS